MYKSAINGTRKIIYRVDVLKSEIFPRGKAIVRNQKDAVKTK